MRMAGNPDNREGVLRGGLETAGRVPPRPVSTEAPAGSFHWDQGRVVIDLNKTVALRRTGSALAFVDVERNLNLVVVHADRGLYIAFDRSRARDRDDVRAYETRREGSRLLIAVGNGK